MNMVLSGFSFSLYVEIHLLTSSSSVTAYQGLWQHFICEMHIQLCVISIELETNPRMILSDFTQRSSVSWSIVSNAADWSKKMTAVASPLAKAR